jgi:pimeloyl-ACP methyl ester carboxylesterase
MQVVDNVVPSPDEPCTSTGELDRAFVDPPPGLADGPEGRLSEALRRKARFGEPVRTLAEAALAHLQGRGIVTGGDARSAVHAQALADLAVTGRTNYTRLVSSLSNRSDTAPLEARVLGQLRELLGRRTVSDADARASVRAVISRASAVAWALRGPPRGRATARARLGWIAVSAEDDPPHRPVNVPTAPHAQHDLQLTVGRVPLVLRYMVALPGLAEAFPASPRGFPPDAPPPVIPRDHEVLLFLHGHSSRLEEALSLVPWIHRMGAESGRRFAILALDLPSNGYSSMIDHTVVAPSSESRYDAEHPSNCRFPILDFYDSTLARFIEVLDGVLLSAGRPTLAHRIAAVMGGSLGGNLTLRMARRGDLPWARRVISWSPASVWESWGRATSNPFDAWPGRGRYVDVIKDIAFNRTRERMNEGESPDSREQHIARQFVGEELINGWDWTRWISSQSDKWYRPDWQPCGRLSVEGGRRTIREIYNPAQRRWHWRVAHEQLGFSHWDRVASGQPPAFEQMTQPLLLLAGALDNDDKVKIFDESRRLAHSIPRNSGRALFLQNTGHSIHSERPQLLTREILSFLPTASRPAGTVPLDLYWGASRGDNFTTGTEQGRRDAEAAGYVAVRTEGFLLSTRQLGTVPLDLYWSEARGDNFITATDVGRRDAAAGGYRFARTEGFIYPRAIALRAWGGAFVGAEGGGGGPVDARRPWIREHETFEVIYLGGGRIGLRTHLGFFLCAENGGGAQVVANRPWLGEWETFVLVPGLGGRVGLRAANGQYLCAEGGGGGALVANRPAVREWESFEFVGA